MPDGVTVRGLATPEDQPCDWGALSRVMPAQPPGRGFLETEFNCVGSISISFVYTMKPQCNL